MNILEEQILESWRAHNRMVIFMIENIPEDAMDVTLSKRGGRGVAGQLGHLHTVRVWHLEAHNRKLSRGLVKFTAKKVPTRGALIQAFVKSGEAIENHLRERIARAGEMVSFKRNAVTALVYFVAHESHHRGNIILTMKQSGIRIPEALKWGIWDWNKFSDMNYAERQVRRRTLASHSGK